MSDIQMTDDGKKTGVWFFFPVIANRILAPVICASVILLTACAQPTTMRPTATAQEIAIEAQTEQDYVRNERLKGNVLRGYYSGKPAGPRLESVAKKLVPTAANLCRDLGAAPEKCVFDIHLAKEQKNGESDTLNAYADGKNVYITPAMARFTENDSELAFVLAHEYSHNIMGHVAAQQKNTVMGGLAGLLLDAAVATQGVDTQGGFTKAGVQGATLAFSPQFEQEADYIGLYLLARAGYDYHAAPSFWRRMSLMNPDAIFTRTTHPTNPERFVAMSKTTQEIDFKKTHRIPLIPEFKRK